MNMNLIDTNALMKVPNVRKVAEYDETGEFITYFAVPVEAIKKAPTIEAEPVRHGRWIETRKHLWKKDDDGEIDKWAWDYEFHNGPSCEICHATPCEHCEPDYDEKQNCREHYMCSECGRVVLALEPYCHCGAKMDLKKKRNEDAVD
jgi:hypothetical protein